MVTFEMPKGPWTMFSVLSLPMCSNLTQQCALNAVDNSNTAL